MKEVCGVGVAASQVAKYGTSCDYTGVPELRPGKPRKGKGKSGKGWQKEEKNHMGRKLYFQTSGPQTSINHPY
jgi:hypothetical protein